MKNTNAIQKVTAFIAGASIALGGGAALAASAQADPTATPAAATQVATGSDTIQDVFNGFAASIKLAGGNTPAIASFDATGSATINPRGKHEFDRPDGSGAGLNALKSAWDRDDANATVPFGDDEVKLNEGEVNIARSSSGPSLEGNDYQFIPFALDAVTYATSATGSLIPSDLPLTADDGAHAGTAADPKPLSLENIYNGGNTYVSDGAGHDFYVGTGTPEAGYTRLNVYVPQSNSGTRKFWSQTLGFNNTTLPAGVTDTKDGEDIQEHNGLAVYDDPVGIVPFSIAQHIAQNNATGNDPDKTDNVPGEIGNVPVTNRSYGVSLNSIDGVSPTEFDEDSNTVLNSSFPVARDVYAVIPTAKYNDESSVLAQLFRTGITVDKVTSNIYSAQIDGQLAITAFGFGTETHDPLGVGIGANL